MNQDRTNQIKSGQIRASVRRSKFTEQIFTPQTEHNFQLRAQIILLLRVAEQFMEHLLFFFWSDSFYALNVCAVCMCACRTLCFPAPAPVQIPFRLGFAEKKVHSLQSKISQNKSSKFIKIGKWATFLTLIIQSPTYVTDHGPPGRSRVPKPHILFSGPNPRSF